MSPQVAAVVVVAVVVVGADVAVRAWASRHVQTLFARGDFAGVVAFTRSPAGRVAFDPFVQRFLRLNAYLLADHVDEALAAIDDLLSLGLKPAQHEAVVRKALRLYVEKGRKVRARQLAEAEAGTKLGEWCREVYEVCFEGSVRYRKQMEQQLAAATGDEAAELAFYLYLQCRNAGDAAGARKYHAMVEKAAA